MSKRKTKKLSTILTTVVVILVVALVAGSCFVLFKPAETREISSFAFSRGNINALGNPVDSETSIYTSDMFGCVGLIIEPDEESTVSYRVYYYDVDKNFLKSTAEMTGVYENDYPFAKYARVVVTPTGEETKAEDFRIGIFDVTTYADMLTITVDATQASIWKEVNVPVSAKNRIRDCIYDGEYWVTVGINGQITYSTDAEQWVVVNAELSDQLTSVAYGKGKYVVVSFESGIYTSDKVYDGWTNTLSISNLESVVFTGDKFIAVGDEGLILTSTDGSEWTEITRFTTNDLTDVLYTNGTVIAVGSNGTVFVSENCIDWYDHSTDMIDDIRTVYHDNGKYYVAGLDGQILVSSTLSNWVEAVSTSSSDVRYVRDIASYDDALFAAAYTQNGYGEIWISEDSGLTWNVVLQSDSRLWIAESGDGKLLVGGDNGRLYILE